MTEPCDGLHIVKYRAIYYAARLVGKDVRIATEAVRKQVQLDVLNAVDSRTQLIAHRIMVRRA